MLPTVTECHSLAYLWTEAIVNIGICHTWKYKAPRVQLCKHECILSIDVQCIITFTVTDISPSALNTLILSKHDYSEGYGMCWFVIQTCDLLNNSMGIIFAFCKWNMKWQQQVHNLHSVFCFIQMWFLLSFSFVSMKISLKLRQYFYCPVHFIQVSPLEAQTKKSRKWGGEGWAIAEIFTTLKGFLF